MITVQELREKFHYSPKTGSLTWRARKYSRGYKGVLPGKEVGWPSVAGYMKVCINYKHYFLHRIIWALVYGEFPRGQIDHIDGDKANNRITNLREADPSQNCANRKLHSNNRHGMKGVTPSYGRWTARVAFRGKRHHIGTFDTQQEAYAAYLNHAEKIHGEFARAK